MLRGSCKVAPEIAASGLELGSDSKGPFAPLSPLKGFLFLAQAGSEEGGMLTPPPAPLTVWSRSQGGFLEDSWTGRAGPTLCQ